MAGDTSVYTDLITSEHADKPNYTEMVGQTVQPFADLTALLGATPDWFDLDTAIGAQLDVDGQWVGISRNLATPLTGVYFAFDTASLGFDQGIWQGPYDPSTGLEALPDDFYRLLLRVKILNNVWDGGKDTLNAFVQEIFNALGYNFFLEDKADLTINLGLVGSGPPNPIAIALLTQGYLDIKPVGVRIAAYLYQQQAGPLFAFDLNTTSFAGFDQGGWAAVMNP